MRTWLLAGNATLLGVAFMVVLRIPGVSDLAILLVSDLGQLAAAALSAVACAVAARRSTGHRRAAWWWLSASTGSWAVGQLVWTWYEVALDREVPFPSLADIGFLVSPLAAAVGLVVWLGTQSDQLVARGRDVMDGVIIAVSLLVLSWVTTLGSVVAGGGTSGLPMALSLAYPIGDLILATLVLIALARGSGAERATLAVLGLGLGGLAFADSAYVYLTSVGAYTSAGLISSGWVFGFLLVAAAGFSVAPDGTDRHGVRARGRHATPRPSRLRLLLPYVPLVAAGVALCTSLLRAERTATVDLLLGIGLVLVVLTRQFLAMADNQRLLVALAEARDQLEHQALHDSLTGLPNRVLFADRLDRALLTPAASVSVLFCDLDDFKLVNDQLGHEAGDVLLKHVAQRLLGCVRITDTVCRLGGDEFAILLDDYADAVQVADRVVAAMQKEVSIRGRSVRTSISVGIAHHQGTPPQVEERRESTSADAIRRTQSLSARTMAAVAEREATAALLLRLADTAMYAAKGAGKGRAVLAEAAGKDAPTQ
jgi:diguanylate cyclase